MAETLTIDEMQVLITASAKEFTAQMDQIKAQLNGLAKNAESSTPRISTAAVAAGNIIANVFSKAFSVVSSSMDSAISRLDTLNNFPRVMSNLGIGSKEASNAISFLNEKLLGLPTTIDSAALAVQRFTSANNSIAASTQIFLALNNALLAGGASTEVQASALEQLSQAYAKGKPDAMEWRSMMQAMPAQLKQVANAMGYSSIAIGGDLQTAIQNGRVSMNELMATFVKLNKDGYGAFKSFEEQARGATGGVATSITNLKTAIVRGMQQIMDAIGQSNISGFFNAISSAIGTAANYIAAFVKVVISAVNALKALFGGKASSSASKTASSLETASSAVSGIASSAGNATKGINGTTAAAKKLNKQLAAFDEMNVLKEQDTGSSGGSGGGGGGIDVGDLGAFNGLDLDIDGQLGKAADKVEEIAKRIKKILNKMFDFNKIGAAIERFGKDIKKFLEPAGKILSDVWGHIKPFISWVGNDLLPAFLNALGGAINLVGTVIGQVWDSMLKPFIDLFLVPIAQFTGGIIVGVLNAVGDALRWIASNDAAVNVIIALMSAFAAYQIVTTATTAVNAFMDAFTIAKAGIPAAQAAIEVGGGAFASFGAHVGSATASFGGLKATLMGVAESVFSPLGIAVAAVTLAITTFRVVQEANTLATMQAELAERQRIDAEKLAQQATEWHNEAIERQKQLKDELRAATEEVTSAELNLVNSQQSTASALDNATSEARKHGMTLEEAQAYVKKLDLSSGNLSATDLSLAQAVLKLEDAQNRQKDATDRLSKAKGTVAEKTQEVSNQQWKEIMSMEEASLKADIQAGKYNEVAQKLKNLGSNSKEYQLANGEMAKFTQKDMEQMANFIGDQLAKINDGNGKAWERVWKDAEYSVNKLKGPISGAYYNSMLSSGENFQKGVSGGITGNQWRVDNAAKNSALSAQKAFNSTLQIHSPSKLMAKSGGFFSQGVAGGILSKKREVQEAAQSLASIAQTSFDTGISEFDVSKSIADGNLSEQFNLDLKETPVHVTVKVGEDTLLNKVIDGINDASFLTNGSVINV